MKRYKELVYEDKTYTEAYKIDEILIKNKFEWFLDCEVENARIEILKNTLVFNSGVFFNGTWVYGVFRDGQWKYGTWEGGVWYNGTWYNGIFKNGIIFGGRFIAGKIEGGEIRGGEIFDVQISQDVVNNTISKMEQPKKAQKGEPQNRGVQQKEPQAELPQVIQPEKIEERIKRFDTFANEGFKTPFAKSGQELIDDFKNTIKIAERSLNILKLDLTEEKFDRFNSLVLKSISILNKMNRKRLKLGECAEATLVITEIENGCKLLYNLITEIRTVKGTYILKIARTIREYNKIANIFGRTIRTKENY